MTPVRANHVGIALLPLCLVLGLLGLNVYLYGDAGIEGPNQLALLLGGGVAAVIGLQRGRSWQPCKMAC